MSTDLVRDLFHSLETTLHDRLKVIEELLVRSSSTGRGSSTDTSASTAAIADLKNTVDELIASHNRTMLRVEMLETTLYPLRDRIANDRILMKEQETRLESMEARLATLESKAGEKPVEAAEAEVEEEAAVVAETEVLETEEEVEEEEEEEVEEIELEEFTHKGKTYCRDQHNNVYGLDEDGSPTDEVIAIWNPTTQRLTRVSPNV